MRYALGVSFVASCFLAILVAVFFLLILLLFDLLYLYSYLYLYICLDIIVRHRRRTSRGVAARLLI